MGVSAQSTVAVTPLWEMFVDVSDVVISGFSAPNAGSGR